MPRTTLNDRQRVSKRLTIEERQDQAFTMRLHGETFRAIAAQLEVSPKQAFDDYHAGLARYQQHHQAAIDEMVALEVARYEQWMRALVDYQGSPAHTMAFLALSKARRDLLGLDAPQRIEHSGHVNVNVSELSDADLDALARGESLTSIPAIAGTGRD